MDGSCKPKVFESISVQRDCCEDKFTNFTKATFRLSPVEGAGEKHTCYVYRFWAYGNRLNVPVETAYFLKLVQNVNLSNPGVQTTETFKSSKNKNATIDPHKTMVNYLFHSE